MLSGFFLQIPLCPSSPHPFLNFGVTPVSPAQGSRSARVTEGPPLRRPSPCGLARRGCSGRTHRRKGDGSRVRRIVERRGRARRLWTSRTPFLEFNVSRSKSRTRTEPIGRPREPRRDAGGSPTVPLRPPPEPTRAYGSPRSSDAKALAGLGPRNGTWSSSFVTD